MSHVVGLKTLIKIDSAIDSKRIILTYIFKEMNKTLTEFNKFLKKDIMCRNIKTLFNFEPVATEEEIYASSLQYVRKISGFTKPSKVNEDFFYNMVDEIASVTRKLVDGLETNAVPKNREEEARKAKERARARFG